jgi:hypothetical protein
MNSNKYFTAANAKALAETARTLDGAYMRDKTLQILAGIEKEATKGNQSLQIYEKLDKVLEARLIELGYSIYVYHAVDQRDDSYFTVSW